MPKLPQDYIDFIAKGIVYNLGLEGIELKESYSEEDLLLIFNCKTKEDLYVIIDDIEKKTIESLGLPVKDSYTTEELEEHLNLAPGMVKDLGTAFEKFPEIHKK